MPPKKGKSGKSAQSQLVDYFTRNGYKRVPDDDRRGEEGATVYKKGYEIRLVARTKAELAEIRRLLREVGVKAGKPFQKSKQWVQPIYGAEAMQHFDEWLEKHSR